MLDEKRIEKDLAQGSELVMKYSRMDLSCDEMSFLLSSCLINDRGTFNAISKAFELGMARGYRVGNRRNRKCRNTQQSPKA